VSASSSSIMHRHHTSCPTAARTSLTPVLHSPRSFSVSGRIAAPPPRMLVPPAPRSPPGSPTSSTSPMSKYTCAPSTTVGVWHDGARAGRAEPDSDTPEARRGHLCRPLPQPPRRRAVLRRRGRSTRRTSLVRVIDFGALRFHPRRTPWAITLPHSALRSAWCPPWASSTPLDAATTDRRRPRRFGASHYRRIDGAAGVPRLWKPHGHTTYNQPSTPAPECAHLPEWFYLCLTS